MGGSGVVAYSPFTWKDGNAGGTPLTAQRLNAIEQGIKTAADVADSAYTGLSGKASTTQVLPAGGASGQLLVKNSSADYAVGWQTPSNTVAAHTHGETDVTSLIADLQAIRTNAFGGSARTKRPAGFFYTSADAAYSAATDTAFASGCAKEYESDTGMITLGSGQNAPTEITVPVTGIYLIEYHVQSSAVTGAFYGRVVLNGTNANTTQSRATTQQIATHYAGATGEGTAFHFAVARSLTAGDRLQFTFYATVAGTLKATFFGGARQTRMGASYLCPSS